MCKKGKKSADTPYYCETCSVDDAKLYLCNNAHRTDQGNTKSYFVHWHTYLQMGKNIPADISNAW